MDTTAATFLTDIDTVALDGFAGPRLVAVLIDDPVMVEVIAEWADGERDRVYRGRSATEAADAARATLDQWTKREVIAPSATRPTDASWIDSCLGDDPLFARVERWRVARKNAQRNADLHAAVAQQGVSIASLMLGDDDD